MDIRDISLNTLESMLTVLQQRRDSIQSPSVPGLQALADNGQGISEINSEEDQLVKEWLSELLSLFDRVNGDDKIDDELARKWINAQWQVNIGSGRYQLECSATDALHQFVTNRHKVDSIHRAPDRD